jgi:superfamily I DNA/RNA helicase
VPCRQPWTTVAVAYGLARVAGDRSGRIMLLTFTRRALDEMLRRARRALGETECRTLGTVWADTFHSVANRLLQREVVRGSDFQFRVTAGTEERSYRVTPAS